MAASRTPRPKQAAMIRSTSRPTDGSSQARWAGLVSGAPGDAASRCRARGRSAAPAPAAARAAGGIAPQGSDAGDIQKCACTTSGGFSAQSSLMPSANWPRNGSSSSFGTVSRFVGSTCARCVAAWAPITCSSSRADPPTSPCRWPLGLPATSSRRHRQVSARPPVERVLRKGARASLFPFVRTGSLRRSLRARRHRLSTRLRPLDRASQPGVLPRSP